MLTAALVDRLTHHAHILNMNGTSFRLKQRTLDKGPVIDDTKKERKHDE
jgi:hypothetical protein